MKLLILIILSLFESIVAAPTERNACTSSNASVRKEWASLTEDERTDYINAVLCMQNKEPRLPASDYPGVKNRMDDFTAVHINMTLSIHMSGIFLAWHRNFVWLWEQALREECGYKGYQPYWNYPLWATNLSASPLFNGSPTSLSGNGYFNASTANLTLGNATLPGGTGGGCVISGPFKNMTVNLGPFDFDLAFGTAIPSDAFDYNPRCLLRSLNDWVTTTYLNQTAIDVLLNSSSIIDFQTLMAGIPPSVATLGIHGGAHNAIGAALQDFFASPSDPAFMVHHGMIDRLWTIWQATNETRRYAINGSSTIWYATTTPEATLNTTLDWNILGDSKTMLELMDPLAYDFCYQYT